MATPVLMFMNMKGGVGKTTLAVELSVALARYNRKRVLLVDYDPQSNASLAFLETQRYFRHLDQGKSIANCLIPDAKEADPFSVIGASSVKEIDCNEYSVRVRSWVYRNQPDKQAGRVDLIPGNLELMRVALNMLDGPNEHRLLDRWNALIKSAKGVYDCIVIDCHPAGSFFTKSALLASDAVIVPTTSDSYAATGLSMMRKHMEMWESSGGAKDYLIIFNDAHKAWDGSVEAAIRGDARFSSHCLTTRIAYSGLFRNLAKRHSVAAEQPVPYKRTVGSNVFRVSCEMVELLKRKSIFDSSWS